MLAAAMPGKSNPSTLKSGGGMGGGLVTPGSTLKGGGSGGMGGGVAPPPGVRPGATSPRRGIGALSLGAKSGGRTKPSVAASLASAGAKQKEKDNMGMASWDWKRVKAHMEVGTSDKRSPRHPPHFTPTSNALILLIQCVL